MIQRNLSGTHRKYLRGLAHKLEPLVHIGQNGLSESVLSAIDQALKDHELIKVKFGDFKEDKDEICNQIADALKAECTGTIGHIGIFYRPNPEKKNPIILPGS